MSDFASTSNPAWDSTGGTGGHAPGPRAGFWIRFGAWLIDAVVLMVIGMVLSLILRGAGGLVSTLVGIGYVVYFFGGPRGQTPGYMVTGLRVVSADGSGSIGYGRATLRWLVSIPSGLVIFLGYFWMLWEPDHRTWFDLASGSVVVSGASNS